MRVEGVAFRATEVDILWVTRQGGAVMAMLLCGRPCIGRPRFA